jgi:hypothetical protein
MDAPILRSVFVEVMTAHRIVIQNARTNTKRMRCIGSKNIDVLLALEICPHPKHDRLFQRDEPLVGGGQIQFGRVVGIADKCRGS